MKFNPHNLIVQLCLKGMGMEDAGKTEEARMLFTQAWNEAADEFERYLAAYYVARQQKSVFDKLKWYEVSLQHALQIDDIAVKGDGRERVYMVEPTGSFENDPNVTDKKFPGNLTRSYRSEAPLTIVREITDWTQ